MAGSALRRGLIGLVAGTAIGAALGIVAYVALAQLRPRYAATVLYHVIESPAAGAAAQLPPVQLQGFVGSQVATLMSDETLERTLEQPDVAQTEWAKGQSGQGGFAPSMALPTLRGMVSAEAVPGTTLFSLHVSAPRPDDAVVIATAIDEVYRRGTRNDATRDARALIDELERKIRDLRQDIAAIDVRSEQIVRTQKIGGPVEQSLAYQERSLLISRLAEVRAALAELPAPGEEGAPPNVIDERAPAEAIAERLRRRIAELDDQVARIVTASTDVEHLEDERARKLKSIRELDSVHADLALKAERGGPVRVLAPPRTPVERSFPTPVPIIGAALVSGAFLGLLVGVARDGATSSPLAP